MNRLLVFLCLLLPLSAAAQPKPTKPGCGRRCGTAGMWR
jgi:hypothetical protein